MMHKPFYLVFAILCYAIFFATFLYLIGFLADLPQLPRTVDHGPAAAPIVALIVDLAAIALFALQHSVMARLGFKRAWTRIVPEPIERSVYVLCASFVLIILFVAWRPLPALAWAVPPGVAADALWAVFALGWAIVLTSTFLINHFELFGLSQAVRRARDTAAVAPTLRRPLFYAFVRHPLYTGFLIAMWATPVLSVGHAVFAGAMTIYVLIAIGLEERDLIAVFGESYRSYRREVGMLVPGLGRRG